MTERAPDAAATEAWRGWRSALAEPELLLCQLILLLFVVLTGLQVVMRYVFNAPLTWPEEISSMLLIWLTFLGAAAVARRNVHLRVELLEELAGERAIRALYLVFDVVILAFLIYLIVGGIELVQQLEFERTPALRIKLAYVVAAVPVAAALMAVYYAGHIVRGCRAVLGRGHDGR